MPTLTKHVELADFLAEAAWLRRLAASLVSPEHADDLVQETWTQLAANPPQQATSVRGWLAQVARNAARMRWRAGARRQAREDASALAPVVPDPEQLVARSQRLRLLARLVEALDEPFRGTVLLHYFEGISLADIARQSKTPDGTVRWRLKKGLQQLREALDEEHGGDRMVWLSAFAPMGILPAGIGGEAGSGAGMSAIVKIVVAGAVVVGVGGAGVALWGPKQPVAPAAVLANVGPMPGEAPRSAETPKETAAETQTGSANQPKLPDQSASGRALLSGPEDRRHTLAALRSARLKRLGDAGIKPGLADEAAADAKLLGDIEQMMMLEDASTLAAACAEVAPPEARGMLYVSVEFIGEPDIGTLIDRVIIDQVHSDAGAGEFVVCLRESLFMLSLPPPAAGGSQSTSFFFDTDAESITVGQGSPTTEAPAP